MSAIGGGGGGRFIGGRYDVCGGWGRWDVRAEEGRLVKVREGREERGEGRAGMGNVYEGCMPLERAWW